MTVESNAHIDRDEQDKRIKLLTKVKLSLSMNSCCQLHCCEALVPGAAWGYTKLNLNCVDLPARYAPCHTHTHMHDLSRESTLNFIVLIRSLALDLSLRFQIDWNKLTTNWSHPVSQAPMRVGGFNRSFTIRLSSPVST